MRTIDGEESLVAVTTSGNILCHTLVSPFVAWLCLRYHQTGIFHPHSLVLLRHECLMQVGDWRDTLSVKLRVTPSLRQDTSGAG